MPERGPSPGGQSPPRGSIHGLLPAGVKEPTAAQNIRQVTTSSGQPTAVITMCRRRIAVLPQPLSRVSKGRSTAASKNPLRYTQGPAAPAAATEPTVPPRPTIAVPVREPRAAVPILHRREAAEATVLRAAALLRLHTAHPVEAVLPLREVTAVADPILAGVAAEAAVLPLQDGADAGNCSFIF